MHATPEQIEHQARHDAHMRQLRAEFEKLWKDKLHPRMSTLMPEQVVEFFLHGGVEIAIRDLCWIAFKEGK